METLKGGDFLSGQDSYKGKLWSTAVQKAFEAPFPEVAIQHLLNRVDQKSRIETLEELLSMKWEAYNEREAISPMRISARVSGDGIPPFTGETVRQLQYVKVFDIEKLLNEAKAEFPQETGPQKREHQTSYPSE